MALTVRAQFGREGKPKVVSIGDPPPVDVRLALKHGLRLQVPHPAIRVRRISDGSVVAPDDAASLRQDELLIVDVLPFVVPASDAKFEGRFRLDGDKLGEGTFSQVFTGKDNETGAAVAIKVVDVSMLSGEKLQGYHVLEKEIVAQVQHRNIVTTHAVVDARPEDIRRVFEDSDATSSVTFFVMELCAGGTLAETVRRVREGECHFSEGHLRKLVSQIASAFCYLNHEPKVCHRDLKPANILLSSTDLDVAEFKIADFGFARPNPQGSQELIKSFPMT
jgi:Protein kinase domain